MVADRLRFCSQVVRRRPGHPRLQPGQAGGGPVVADLLPGGIDPARVNAAGQEISDDRAAAGLAWLKSKMARAASYDLAAEAQAVRDHVSRQKAQRLNPED